MPSSDPPLSSTPPQHAAPRLSSAASRRSHRKTVSADFLQRVDSSDEDDVNLLRTRPALFSPRKGSVGTETIQRELRNAGWSIAPDDAKAAALSRSRSRHPSIISHRSRHQGLTPEQEDVLRTALEAVSIAQAALISARDALEDALGDTLSLGASANITPSVSSGSNIAPAARSDKSQCESKLPLMSQRNSFLGPHSDGSESEASFHSNDSGPAGRALLTDAPQEPVTSPTFFTPSVPSFPFDLDTSKVLTQASASSTRDSTTLVKSPPPAAPRDESLLARTPSSDAPYSTRMQRSDAGESPTEMLKQEGSPFGLPSQLWPRHTPPAQPTPPQPDAVVMHPAPPSQVSDSDVDEDNSDSDVKEHESGDTPQSFGSLRDQFSHVRAGGAGGNEESPPRWSYEEERKRRVQDETDESMEILGEWLLSVPSRGTGVYADCVLRVTQNTSSTSPTATSPTSWILICTSRTSSRSSRSWMSHRR